ncbi:MULTISPECIES: hypothetical protein [Pseudomonas]|jgi:hypothetical protein|uniref:hypothetical protein n=1 Tax=Pseudomonas TaxID=286 RepID=UPI00062B01CE|nr:MULTISPECIES: hypothetical protein [Pseudomonas]KKX57822.1 conserved secreted protein with internal repeat protein [Pseudomonas putida]NBB58901.1 hypothetical protein [Pseudomonas sp. ODNR1LW]OMQ39025.1 hypothetical protein BKX96_07335 [Pseudomonas putida]
MKNTRLAVLFLAASLTPLWVTAAEQSQATQTQQQTPSVAEFDKQMAQAQETFKKMQAQMEKIQQTQDPQQRQKLLQEHWNTMQNGMSMMNGMWGPGMMGNGRMMGGKHMMGWQDYSNLTPEQKSQRQYMMDRYTGMQQMMMDNMMRHQNYMQMQPMAKPGQ